MDGGGMKPLIIASSTLLAVALLSYSAASWTAHLDAMEQARLTKANTEAVHQDTRALQAIHDRIAPAPMPSPRQSETFGNKAEGK